MKVLCCVEPGLFRYQERTEPRSQPGHALLKIRRIGICGTDLHAFEGTQPFFEYPRVLGHELAADIVEVDEASGFQQGDAVTIIPYFNCSKCIACRNGKPNCCVSIKVCGVHIDGGMVEYLSVPTYSLVRSRGLNHDQLALVEPLAIGAHAVTRAAIQEHDVVLVVGAGPIGLAVMQFVKIAGARLIAMDHNPSRLSFCERLLQPDESIGKESQDVVAALASMTGGDMPTVVIDATGNLTAINNGFGYLAHGGKYILVGLQKKDIQCSHPEFHKREATLMSSRNATRADFENVVDRIASGTIDPLQLITHRTSFDEVAKRFSGWMDPGQGVVKAMVEVIS